MSGKVDDIPHASLRLDASQDILFPNSPVQSGATVLDVFVDGRCTGPGKVQLAAKDSDWFFDDLLDRQDATCDAHLDFEAEFRLWCAGLFWPDVEGPRGASGENPPELYVKDLNGSQMIPFPGGRHFWYPHCTGAELEVVDHPD